MIKHVCDRCGKEIQKRHPLTIFLNGEEYVYDYEMTRELCHYGKHKKRWELCHDCSEKIMKFIEGVEDVKDEKI